MSTTSHPATAYLYEVTIDVPISLVDKYGKWLVSHIEEMKSHLHGILSVETIARENDLPAPDNLTNEEFKGKPYRRFIVQYIVENRDQIDDYIANRSAPMRTAAIDTFGQETLSCFRFERRVVPVAEK